MAKKQLGVAPSNTVDAATKAYVDTAVAAMQLPVGTVLSFGVSTNPSTLLGYGTWTRIQGRFIVGVSDSDTDFDLDDTGGHKELQQHNHGVTDPGHVHRTGGFSTAGSGGSDNYDVSGHSLSKSGRNTDSDTTDITIDNAGTGDGGNLPPFIAKYIWQRTA